ncbi:serine/threonine protein kinase [Chitinivibrio alkaliphilus]|uniref:Serine/threonine protein kinase n=1 Tax=Chitinivibrio alkaliphilus ACht1 TaxID=1313304 RepID=U7D8S7_9BACT|nr:serine/threonine-protein kinase [Chitinivibrio alkaliphilus]ERP39340.1 serine/threonine protein kinase [Chitinivibrio alkaliphilus ACht1]
MKSIFDYISIDYTDFIGRKLDTITLLDVIGSGGKGVVFSGFQEDLKRRVAVKILPKIKTRQSEIDSFSMEAQIVAGLTHPNIIPIYKMGEEDEFYYQVMHLVEGDNLVSMVQKRKRHPIKQKRFIPVSRAVALICDVLKALSYAHEEFVVHRDIKPANIIIEKKHDRLFVVDFGIAKAPGLVDSMHESIIVGSPLYLSPEQARGGDVDHRSDIYSTAMTLVYLLLGLIPTQLKSPEEVVRCKIASPDSFIYPHLSRLRTDIPKELEGVLLKAIAADPDQRIESSDQFCQLLTPFSEHA